MASYFGVNLGAGAGHHLASRICQSGAMSDSSESPRTNRVALVTGANQGVGLQVAKELVANGLTVLVGSRNFDRGEAAAKEIGPGAIALQLDVTDAASIAAAAERIRTEVGRLDLLVNNAAISNTTKGRPVPPGVRQDVATEQRVPR